MKTRGRFIHRSPIRDLGIRPPQPTRFDDLTVVVGLRLPAFRQCKARQNADYGSQRAPVFWGVVLDNGMEPPRFRSSSPGQHRSTGNCAAS